jgi:hypothetical protein
MTVNSRYRSSIRIIRVALNSSSKLITLAILVFILGNQCQAQKKPNIGIIISDDHAYQAISAYGSKLMQTPNIDRIAKERGDL